MKICYTLFLKLLLLVQNAQAIITSDGFEPEKSAAWAAKSFPNVCEVVVSFTEGNGGTISSGVLISPISILTSAHSVRAGKMLHPDQPPIIDFAPIGCEFNSEKPFRFASTVIPHPDHRMGENYYCEGVDLAILKFDEPITDISPVKLWDSKIPDNKIGYIVGYGKGGLSSKGATTEQHIRHMGTTRINRSDSNYLYYDFSPIKYIYGQAPDTFIRTPGMDNLQAIPTAQDSGGPLLFGKAPNDLSVAGIAHGGSIQMDSTIIMPYLNGFLLNPI